MVLLDLLVVLDRHCCRLSNEQLVCERYVAGRLCARTCDGEPVVSTADAEVRVRDDEN